MGCHPSWGLVADKGRESYSVRQKDSRPLSFPHAGHFPERENGDIADIDNCRMPVSVLRGKKGDIADIDNCRTPVSVLGHLSIFAMSPFSRSGDPEALSRAEASQ